jgi:antitoxin component HigA of HigAB toxin-antitoxin module
VFQPDPEHVLVWRVSGCCAEHAQEMAAAISVSSGSVFRSRSEEQEHYSIPAADPASVVRFLIEQQNLTQRDLIPQFGSESAVSMFLAGQRNLTIEQVRKLSSRFKLPADVFIPKSAVGARA